MKRCPKCKASLHDYDVFCVECGAKYEETKELKEPKVPKQPDTPPPANTKSRKWTIIFFVFVCVFMVIIYAAEKSKANRFSADNAVLQSVLDKTQADYDVLKTSYIELYKKNKLAIIDITSLEVGNWADDWIQSPGETLNAQDIKYLRPDITYNSSINAELTFNVKIFDPGYVLSRNTKTSPAGYTYSQDVNVSAGDGNNATLSGWGNAEGGAYYGGTWQVDVWWENVLLARRRVKLN
jgi:hypothetical protein